MGQKNVSRQQKQIPGPTTRERISFSRAIDDDDWKEVKEDSNSKATDDDDRKEVKEDSDSKAIDDNDWKEVKEDSDLNNIFELPNNMLYREFNNTFIICSRDIPKSDREYCYEVYKKSVHGDSKYNNTYCVVTTNLHHLRLKDSSKVVSIISFKEYIKRQWFAKLKEYSSVKHLCIVKPKSLPKRIFFDNERFSMQIQSLHMVIDISSVFCNPMIKLPWKVDSFILEVVNDTNYPLYVLKPEDRSICVSINNSSEIGKL